MAAPMPLTARKHEWLDQLAERAGISKEGFEYD